MLFLVIAFIIGLNLNKIIEQQMLKVKVNENQTFITDNKNGQLLLNDNLVEANWQKIGDQKYHLIYKDVSYTIELLQADDFAKQLTILVNGIKHQVSISNKYDELLKQLGMDKLAGAKVNDVKAPMPGMVLRLHVNEGDKIKKGDPLLVLEAMKMENIIKAAGDGVVKKINISEKTAVEKNQVLIVMD
jgi:biotin carboxyl carrier protein